MTGARPPLALLRALADGPGGLCSQAPNPDAGLVTLCDQFIVLEHELSDAGEGPNAIADDDQFDQLVLEMADKMQPLLAQMHQMHATSVDGIFARLRAWTLREHFYLEELLASEAINEQLLGLLIRDIRACGGASIFCHGGKNPDAELIRICAEHPAVIAVCEGQGLDDDHPLWLAYDASRDAISDAEPQTLAGIVAKARIARDEANNGAMGAEWCEQIADDLVRLFGGAALVDSPDAELLKLCAQFVELEAAERRRDMGGDDYEAPAEHGELIAAIRATPARTTGGNRAKLACAVAFYGGDPPEEGCVMGDLMWDAVTALAMTFPNRQHQEAAR